MIAEKHFDDKGKEMDQLEAFNQAGHVMDQMEKQHLETKKPLDKIIDQFMADTDPGHTLGDKYSNIPSVDAKIYNRAPVDISEIPEEAYPGGWDPNLPKDRLPVDYGYPGNKIKI